MKVMLTGANGHIGANTTRALLKNGHEVVAFVRSTSDLRGLDGLDVTYVHGDVTEVDSLTSGAEGCDAIIHTAAVFRYWSKDPEAIKHVSMEGAKNIIDAAQNAGVQRLVYTSSTWAIGLSDDPQHLLTAQDWNQRPQTPYAQAKTYSEQMAWDLAEQANIDMIALCPGAIFGPYDYRITPSNQTLLGMADGSGQSFDAGMAIADARDVGTIHALAVDHGEPGQRYAITHNLTFKELAAYVTAVTGRKVTHIGAPKPVMRLVAGLMELGANFTGKEPPVTRALVDDAAEKYMFIDSAPTWEVFQHTPYTVSETIQATIDWFVEIGKLPPIQQSA